METKETIEDIIAEKEMNDANVVAFCCSDDDIKVIEEVAEA